MFGFPTRVVFVLVLGMLKLRCFQVPHHKNNPTLNMSLIPRGLKNPTPNFVALR